ncbi:MAG: prepilin-type N-terminal cleavage/methylation domain-containing protein [Deltaproteobacteria bacterium]|nr:prepilin-type N-terminal cleavage/methylation domain-containing protein [Deltaproteobacteria bacterium]
MTSRAVNSRRGFSLIEVMITMVIVGLVMGLAVGQLGRSLSWDLKAASRKLGSTIRYLYNKSATEGVTLRLVFDIDNSSYHVEGTSDRFTFAKEEKTPEDQKKEEDKEKGSIQPKVASFSPQESYLLKPVTLPKGVFFKNIHAEHQSDPVSSGTAYIYFFPRGYVERSIINLRDAKDEVHFALTVNPIAGTVKIEKEYRELEIEK